MSTLSHEVKTHYLPIIKDIRGVRDQKRNPQQEK